VAFGQLKRFQPWHTPLYAGKTGISGLDWFYKISITCFAASYLVVFALEISRVFFDLSLRKYLRVGFAAAGLLAHTIYLVCNSQLEFNALGIWLGNWFGWCLSASWLLAAAYLWISLRQPESVTGLFILPVVMILIWIGILFGKENQFSVSHARSVWTMVHGASLVLGTAVVALGFIFGVVYLLQASRLKRKVPQSKLFRLPSLEWLQQSSERSLLVSTMLLAVGLVSGIAINQVGSEGAARSGVIAWSDPVIWSSGILFAWLLAVITFNLFYRPARRGRKVAYLVVASFLFLVLELGIVWWAGHAYRGIESEQAALSAIPISQIEPMEERS
jgi:ABC-type uncharacterized transport system permease subunit